VPTYAYKCVDRGQKIVRGVREAAHAFELARLLQAEGLTALSIAEAGATGKSWLPQLAIGGGELSRSDVILLLSNLEMLLSAGVDLNAALSALAKSTKKKELQGVVRELRDSVQKGQSFADGLRRSHRISVQRICLGQTFEHTGVSAAGGPGGSFCELQSQLGISNGRHFGLHEVSRRVVQL